MHEKRWNRRLGATAALVFTIALFCAQATPLLAQGTLDSKGTDFWLMFTRNHTGASELKLFITGSTATSGVVTVPGIAFTSPFAVAPGVVTSVTIPLAAEVTTSDTITNEGIHVTALSEVTVYGLNRLQFTTDAYLGLPTDILGTEYLTLGYKNSNVVNGSLFGVVATQDATTVTITPTVTTGIRIANVPYSISMNAGQTYQLNNSSAAPADLSGSIVTSNKPVAVFGGHQCANIPPGAVACDHVEEEIPPVNTWGKTFVTIPLATRIGGDTFRFLAATDGTVVTVNGVNVATLNRGQLHERIINGSSSITSTQPILVAQYSNGTSFDGVTSDPFMMMIPPFEQFLGSYTVTTPATGFALNFISVVAPTTSVGAVTLDGVAIPPAAFTPIPGTTFSGAQRSVALGSHNLNGPQPFGTFVYGFADADSYGYPGGLALGQVASVTTITLTPVSATHPINTQQCVTARVTDQNGLPLSSIRVDFSVVGVNGTSGFSFTDNAGNATFCYTGALPGSDSIRGFVGTLGSNIATKTWTSVAPLACDVDGDRDVDMLDLNAINAARNTPASGPTDARDANHDGVINIVDSRYCAIRLTPPPAQ